MNLLGVTAGAISSVNPYATVTINLSTGYTTQTDGTSTPNYTSVSVPAQIQALSGRDLRQIEGLNLNGTLRAVYFYGDIEATVRAAQKGGDLVTFPDGTVWLVSQVTETWPDWCKTVCTLQNGA